MFKILKKDIKASVNDFYKKVSKDYGISSTTIHYGETEGEEGTVSDVIYIEINTNWDADHVFIDLEILADGLKESDINEKINEWAIWLINNIEHTKTGKVKRELLEPKIRVLEVCDSKGNLKKLDRRYVKQSVIQLFTKYPKIILESGEFTEKEYRFKILEESE